MAFLGYGYGHGQLTRCDPFDKMSLKSFMKVGIVGL